MIRMQNVNTLIYNTVILVLKAFVPPGLGEYLAKARTTLIVPTGLTWTLNIQYFRVLDVFYYNVRFTES